MKYLGMTIHCLGVAIAGIWFFSSFFNAKFPKINYTNTIDSIENISNKN